MTSSRKLTRDLKRGDSFRSSLQSVNGNTSEIIATSFEDTMISTRLVAFGYEVASRYSLYLLF